MDIALLPYGNKEVGFLADLGLPSRVVSDLSLGQIRARPLYMGAPTPIYKGREIRRVILNITNYAGTRDDPPRI
jgi:hypothetical protein